MGRVVHFEIHAEQPARAIAFYQRVFGWTFTPWGPPGAYWLVTTGPASAPGIDGGLLPRRGAGPTDGAAVNAFVCTATVEAVEATIDAALEAGGTLAVPKNPIPGVGWLAYVKDTEGNIVGALQNDPAAK